MVGKVLYTNGSSIFNKMYFLNKQKRQQISTAVHACAFKLPVILHLSVAA